MVVRITVTEDFRLLDTKKSGENPRMHTDLNGKSRMCAFCVEQPAILCDGDHQIGPGCHKNLHVCTIL
jgi:hypothetical protein